MHMNLIMGLVNMRIMSMMMTQPSRALDHRHEDDHDHDHDDIDGANDHHHDARCVDSWLASRDATEAVRRGLLRRL